MIPRHVYDKPFTVRWPDVSEWKEGYTDGYGRTRKLSVSLGQYTTIFQAEVYAIQACAVEI